MASASLFGSSESSALELSIGQNQENLFGSRTPEIEVVDAAAAFTTALAASNNITRSVFYDVAQAYKNGKMSADQLARKVGVPKEALQSTMPPIYYGHVKKTTISDSEGSSDDEDEVETTRDCDLFSDEPAAPLVNPGAGDQVQKKHPGRKSVMRHKDPRNVRRYVWKTPMKNKGRLLGKAKNDYYPKNATGEKQKTTPTTKQDRDVLDDVDDLFDDNQSDTDGEQEPELPESESEAEVADDSDDDLFVEQLRPQPTYHNIRSLVLAVKKHFDELVKMVNDVDPATPASEDSFEFDLQEALDEVQEGGIELQPKNIVALSEALQRLA